MQTDLNGGSVSDSKVAKRSIHVVGAVFFEGERVLICRRPPHDTGAGFWEFPGGKIDPGETAEQALHREIKEELEIKILQDLGEHLHSYSTLDVHLRLYLCLMTGGEMVLREHDAFQWVNISRLDPQILLEADRPFVEDIRRAVRLKNKMTED